MVKNKLIQVRLNDTQFNQITEKAGVKDQSVSEYAREILLQQEIKSIEEEPKAESEIPVFQRLEFLKTVIWIYSKEDGRDTESIEEAEYYVSLIDSFIMDLEPKYLDFLYNVKKDLNKIIKEYSPLYRVKYSFNKSYQNTYFNYKEFEKILLNDLM